MFEGLAKLAGLSWLERRAVEGRGIDVRLASGDDHHPLCLFLGYLTQAVVEGNLQKRAVHGLAAIVGDLAFDVGDLLAGKVIRRTHGLSRDNEVRGVRIGRRRGYILVCGSASKKHQNADDDQHRRGADRNWHNGWPRLLVFAGCSTERRYWIGRVAHAEDCTAAIVYACPAVNVFC